MSLINQMLKDLERRAKNPQVPTGYILSGLSAATQKKLSHNKVQYIILSVFLIIFSILVLLFFLYLFKTPDTMKAIASQVTSTAPRISPATSMVFDKEGHAILSGITLQTENNLTDFRLLLNKASLYRVSTDLNNRLIVLLEKTELTVNLPTINTLNSAIDDIQVTKENGDLKISLALKPGTELLQLGFNDSKQAELQLNFLYKTDNTPTIDATTQKVASKTAIKKFRFDVAIDDMYQKALQFYAEGQVNRSIEIMTDILNQEPEYSAARESLINFLIEEGNTEHALKLIKMGLSLQPFYPAYLQAKAQILVKQGKIKQALSELLESPPPLETDPDYFGFVAALYQQNGQSISAKELYQKLLTLEPGNSTWWIGLGVALESLGDRHQALRAYSRANNQGDLSMDLKEYVEERLNALE